MEGDLSLSLVLPSTSYEGEAYQPATAPLKSLALPLFPHRYSHYQLIITTGSLSTEAKG